jgi:MoxR-like ATPase|tara:strand:+ start:2885 stop:3772 length:888 start_codon:yes stop_codon:yes gene_type:complete
MNKEITIPTTSIDFDQYDPKNIEVWDTYIQISDEAERLEKAIISSKYPYLIESEKGQGKTLLVHTLCKKLKVALIEEPIGAGIKKSDLIGTKEINSDGTFFSLGLLPKAICVANHFGHAVLYGDEANAQEHDMQRYWNRICDGRRSIVANGKTYRLKEDCKLTIIWTINPVTYAGINTMTEDLRSRFVGRVWNYPSNADLEKVIDWEGIPSDTVKMPLLVLVQDIYALRMKGDVEYALSIRDIVQFCTYFKDNVEEGNTHSIKTALEEVILIKYGEPMDRELIRIRIKDTFGVVL